MALQSILWSLFESRSFILALPNGLILLPSRFIVPISCVICNDIMAYMFGFFFGRTPLIKVWNILGDKTPFLASLGLSPVVPHLQFCVCLWV